MKVSQDPDDEDRPQPSVAEAPEKPTESDGQFFGFNLSNPEPFDYLPFLEGVSRITLGEEVPETGYPFQNRVSVNIDKANLFEDLVPLRGPVLQLLHVHNSTFYVGLSECERHEAKTSDPDDTSPSA